MTRISRYVWLHPNGRLAYAGDGQVYAGSGDGLWRVQNPTGGGAVLEMALRVFQYPVFTKAVADTVLRFRLPSPRNPRGQSAIEGRGGVNHTWEEDGMNHTLQK